jgi:hypothetical protein
VLLALGNEGFGLPLVEGMATGLPVIALDSEGQSDVCSEAADCVLPVPPARWQVFDEAPFGRCGVRGIPSVEDVAERLRWVAQHRSEAQALGRAASEWTLAQRNIWAMGPALLAAMECHTRPTRPLRRRYTVWVAGGSSPTGAAGYTAALAAALPAVRVTAQPPDLRSVRLLHIQYEDGAWDEAALTGVVQQARYSGVPVVITEHQAGPVARPWERDAAVLVALTADDAALLRARWPAKRVELLPLDPDVSRPRTAAAHLALWRTLESSS